MTMLGHSDYTAKPPAGDRGATGRLPWRQGARKLVYDGALLPYALLRHRILLGRTRRVDGRTHTCFLRAPSQMRLLSGPILDHLGRPERLSITLLASSNGAEAYTIASWLRRSVPKLFFHIQASDPRPEMVARARAGEYSRDEVLHSPYMTEEFLRTTFEERGDRYVVRPEIRAHVSFYQANLLEGEALLKRFRPTQIVVAQNVLFHLEPAKAARAFATLVRLTAPRGVLMVEGMDLGLRERLVALHGLSPFTQNLRQIYEETRVHTPPHWWRVHWGAEPYLAFRRNPERRYATAFAKA